MNIISVNPYPESDITLFVNLDNVNSATYTPERECVKNPNGTYNERAVPMAQARDIVRIDCLELFFNIDEAGAYSICLWDEAAQAVVEHLSKSGVYLFNESGE